MNTPRPPINGSALQTPPLALVFSARLLLAEKSSVTGEHFLAEVRLETCAVRTAAATPATKKTWERRDHGFRHGGINE
jgi:hypothetical protein